MPRGSFVVAVGAGLRFMSSMRGGLRWAFALSHASKPSAVFVMRSSIRGGWWLGAGTWGGASRPSGVASRSRRTMGNGETPVGCAAWAWSCGGLSCGAAATAAAFACLPPTGGPGVATSGTCAGGADLTQLCSVVHVNECRDHVSFLSRAGLVAVTGSR